MKPIIRILLVSLVVLSTSISAFANDWHTIRFATEGAYAPWNFVEPNGQLAGFDIDVMHDLCRRMKADCQIVAQSWDGIIPALNAGKYDAITAAMVITPARKAVVDFTIPYAVGARSFVVQKSGPLAKIGESQQVLLLDKDPQGVQKAVDALKPALKGMIVGVQTATTHAQFLDQYFKGVVQVREYKTSQDMMLDLSSGRIDAAFDGIAFIGGALDTPEGRALTFIGPRFNGGLFGEGSAITVRKGDTDLRDKLSTAIAAARDDGTLSRLSMKWFHIDIAPKK
jgi:octopine/nopaline transport system substrate-binding protein